MAKMQNGMEIQAVGGDPMAIASVDYSADQLDQARRHGRGVFLAEAGVSLLRVDMAPICCDLSNPHDDFAPCFNKTDPKDDSGHAEWLLRWSYGGALAHELKLCDLHRRALAALLAYPDEDAAPAWKSSGPRAGWFGDFVARDEELEAARAAELGAKDAAGRLGDRLATQILEVGLRDGRIEELEEQLESWQDASGLESGGDPGGITPEKMRSYREAVEEECDTAVARVKELEATVSESYGLQKLVEIVALKDWVGVLEGERDSAQEAMERDRANRTKAILDRNAQITNLKEELQQAAATEAAARYEHGQVLLEQERTQKILASLRDESHIDSDALGRAIEYADRAPSIQARDAEIASLKDRVAALVELHNEGLAACDAFEYDLKEAEARAVTMAAALDEAHKEGNPFPGLLRTEAPPTHAPQPAQMAPREGRCSICGRTASQLHDDDPYGYRLSEHTLPTGFTGPVCDSCVEKRDNNAAGCWVLPPNWPFVTEDAPAPTNWVQMPPRDPDEEVIISRVKCSCGEEIASLKGKVADLHSSREAWKARAMDHARRLDAGAYCSVGEKCTDINAELARVSRMLKGSDQECVLRGNILDEIKTELVAGWWTGCAEGIRTLKSSHADLAEDVERQKDELDKIKTELGPGWAGETLGTIRTIKKLNDKWHAEILRLQKELDSRPTRRHQPGCVCISCKHDRETDNNGPDRTAAYLLSDNDLRVRLKDGKYTRWAADYSVERMAGLLWLVGEWSCRASSTDDRDITVMCGADRRKYGALNRLRTFREDPMDVAEVQKYIRECMRGPDKQPAKPEGHAGKPCTADDPAGVPLITDHAYLSAGDTHAADGDRCYTGCFHCGESRSRHEK